MTNMINQPYSIENTISEVCIDYSLVVEASLDLAEKYKCPICYNLVFDPVTCANCDNIVDNNCLINCKKKSNKCPIYGCPVFKSKPNSIHLALDTVKLRCKNNGCSEIIKINDFYTHLNKCPFADYICNSPNCKFVGKLNQVKAHMLKCQKEVEKSCHYCKSNYPSIQIESHEEVCDLRKMSCKICGSNDIKLIAFDDHLKKCAYSNKKISCEICKKSKYQKKGKRSGSSK